MSDTRPRHNKMMARKPVRRKCVGEVLVMKSRMGFHGAGWRCIVLLVNAGGGTVRAGAGGRSTVTLTLVRARATRAR